MLGIIESLGRGRLALSVLCVYSLNMSAATETLALEIPREIPLVTKMTPAELKQELALALYAQGKISFGKARELAGLTVWQLRSSRINRSAGNSCARTIASASPAPN
jgi:hypothetical protein